MNISITYYNLFLLIEKEQRGESDKLHLSYAEDLEISSTNDAMHSPERVRYFLLRNKMTTINS